MLYVSSFRFSLLSVSRITIALNYSVKFYFTFCEFEEVEMKKMVGTWHEEDGLYHVNLVSKPMMYSTFVSL